MLEFKKGRAFDWSYNNRKFLDLTTGLSVAWDIIKKSKKQLILFFVKCLACKMQ